MKSFKIQIEPNDRHRTAFARHAGVARWAYNWGLGVCIEAYKNGIKRPSAFDLQKKLVAEEKSIKPWLYECSKCTPQQALRNLEGAYKRFFKKGGFPKFKKKGHRDSFYLAGSFPHKGRYIKLPKIGWVKCAEAIPDISIKNAVISRTADKWFLTFKTDIPVPKIAGIETMPIIGVDLGIKELAVLSDGTVFKTNRKQKHKEKLLKRLQRHLSRQKKGSKNREKTKRKIAKTHYKIVCSRKDGLHKATTYLAKNHSKVCIEDLAVKNMIKNHRLAKAISNASFGEFRTMLEYKCAWYGSELLVIGRFAPSSKTCSVCGSVKDALKLSERIYRCGCCGAEIDRDLNAAVNIKNMAVSSTVSGYEVCQGISATAGIGIDAVAIKQHI